MRVSNKEVGGARQMSPDWVRNVLNKLENKILLNIQLKMLRIVGN